MVKHVRSTFLLALVASIAAPTAVAAEWQLVEDSSTVRFIGVQEGSAFRGRFQNFSAERDATLLEEDWFNPENFPESRFESDSIEVMDDGTYAAHGQLTIIGNSNPVTMTFEFETDGSAAKFSGSFDILRLDFAVGWDATNWIDDEVGVQVELDLQQ